MRAKPDEWAFWDNYAHRYDRFIRHVRHTYREMILFLRPHCGPETDMLEIGTGTGYVAMNLAPFVHHIEATDVSPEMIREASRALEESPVANVSFSVRDGYATGFHGEAFDLVVISNVMHVVSDPARLLEEAGRVVARGGEVVIATYCHGTNAVTRLVSWLMSLRGFKAHHKWSPETLKTFIGQSGYEIVDETIIRDIIPLAVYVTVRR